MSKVHIASCACGWIGEAEGGTQIVNYFCPKCRTGKYLVSIGDYYPASDVDAKITELEGEIKRLKNKWEFEFPRLQHELKFLRQDRDEWKNKANLLNVKDVFCYKAEEVDAYRAEVRALVEAIRAEPMPASEPAESAWLGRQQVADELAALEADKSWK